MDQTQEVDVEEVMRRIRENIYRRRDAEGHPTPEKPASPFDHGQAAADFAYLHSGYNIQHVSFASHRRVLGPLVVAAELQEVESDFQDLRDNVQPQLREEILAAQSQALHEMHSQLQPALDLLGQHSTVTRERVSRAERKLRRILHAPGSSQPGDGRPELKPVEERPALPLLELEPTFDYAGFEERFRGSEEDVKERQRTYVQYFEDRENVIDIGCGRGEVLELLRARGITARGVDLDLDMVLLCREKGLDVARDDAFAYLEALPDGSVGGIFAAQVIEHLHPRRVIELVKLCYRKLAPGGHLILEPPNPQCLMGFANSFYKDPSHVQPAHPDTMQFLFEADRLARGRAQVLCPRRPFHEDPVPAGSRRRSRAVQPGHRTPQLASLRLSGLRGDRAKSSGEGAPRTHRPGARLVRATGCMSYARRASPKARHR